MRISSLVLVLVGAWVTWGVPILGMICSNPSPTDRQYVVVNYAGDSIADVWVLRDSCVQSLPNSDRWQFVDNQGNVVSVSGDAKVIKISDKDSLDKWHDYHLEFETQSYQEKYGMAGKSSFQEKYGEVEKQ